MKTGILNYQTKNKMPKKRIMYFRYSELNLYHSTLGIQDLGQKFFLNARYKISDLRVLIKTNYTVRKNIFGRLYSR